jgi:H+/gluconate symporter-like permease
MSLILGMDTLVFMAWIGTILTTVFCVIYGIYFQFFKKKAEEIPIKIKEENIENKQG